MKCISNWIFSSCKRKNKARKKRRKEVSIARQGNRVDYGPDKPFWKINIPETQEKQNSEGPPEIQQNSYIKNIYSWCDTEFTNIYKIRWAIWRHLFSKQHKTSLHVKNVTISAMYASICIYLGGIQNPEGMFPYTSVLKMHLKEVKSLSLIQ